MDFLKILRDRPVIAAFRDLSSLRFDSLDRIGIILLLGGSIFDLPPILATAKKHKKMVFVDIDLLKGIGRDPSGVRFLATESRVDGIITTQGSLIKSAKLEGLFSIQRIFILDSESLSGSLNAVQKSAPDAVDVLPGIILPKIIGKIRAKTSVPLIAGGLITQKEDVSEILDAGAIGISTTEQRLFNYERHPDASHPGGAGEPCGRETGAAKTGKHPSEGRRRIYCGNNFKGGSERQ